MTNGFFPPTVPWAPATGNAEKRLMLCIYGETNSAAIVAAWTLSADITYTTKRTIDINNENVYGPPIV